MKNLTKVLSILLVTFSFSYANADFIPDKAERDQYVDNMKGKLDDLDTKVKDIENNLSDKSDDMKSFYSKRIKELENQMDEFDSKLDEYKQSGSDAWIDLKAGSEKTWNRINQTFEDISKNFE